MKITLDSNCLLSLRNRDGEHAEVAAIVALHPDPITLYIPAIAASENQKCGTRNINFDQFRVFLAEIDCEKCELLYPMFYVGVSYLGYAVLSGPESESLEREIHDILFPNIPFLYSEYCRRFGVDHDNGVIDRKWRNAKCDVQAAWCHINYKNDVFVSQDSNFHKAAKKAKLCALGAREILRPSDCLTRLRPAANG